MYTLFNFFPTSILLNSTQFFKKQETQIISESFSTVKITFLESNCLSHFVQYS